MNEKLPSILIGGVSVGVLIILLQLPQVSILGCIACLAYFGSGLVAVWHYTNTHSLTIAGGEGVSMGALAGLVCGVVDSILALILRAIGLLPGAEEAIAEMEESGQLDQMDPEMADMVYGMVEFFTGTGGYIVGIILAVILGLIGGAIGASVFKKGGEATA